jgi:hypothetical protein
MVRNNEGCIADGSLVRAVSICKAKKPESHVEESFFVGIDTVNSIEVCGCFGGKYYIHLPARRLTTASNQ